MNRIILLLILSAILASSCGKKVITRKYYVLELPLVYDSTVSTKTLSSKNCEVLPVRIPPAYSQLRIAVRIRSNEVNYYSTHQWAMNPGENITGMLEKQLTRSRLFANVTSSIWKLIPEYRFQPSIYQIEAIDINDEFSAHLSGRFELIDRAQESVVLMRDFNRNEVLEERDLNLLAKSISKMIGEEMDLFLRDTQLMLMKDEAQLPTIQ